MFTITYGYTKQSELKYILSVCGQPVAEFDTLEAAEIEKQAGLDTQQNWGIRPKHTLLANHADSVQWYRAGKQYKVVYGLQVESTTCDVAAARKFGECVRHYLECESLL